MKKGIIFSVLIMLLASAFVVSCGQKESTSKEVKEVKETATAVATPEKKVKLRMMYWNKEATVKPFLDLAAKKLPNIELEFNFVSVDNFNGTLDTQLQAGEGPDILPAGQSEAYVNAGYLVDLSGQSFIKKYSRASIDAISVNGKPYGVPGISWFEGVFYNKALFEKHGLSVPKTFDEMMALHQKLVDLGIKPQAWGAKSWEPFAKSPLGLAIVDYLQTEEGKGFDATIRDGSGKFAGSALKPIFEKWLQYFEKGYVSKDMLQVDYDSALKEFATGKAAMWESGPWAVNAIKQTNPDLDFDMMPFVGTKTGNEYLIGGPGVTFGVNAQSKHQEEALQVIALMATPEGQQALCAGSPGSGSFLEGANIPLPKEFTSVKNVLNGGRVYCPWFVWKGSDAYNAALGKGLQEVLQGNMTIDQVLADMDQKVQEEMSLRD